MKVLFVLKQRIVDNKYATSYGLINSAIQIANFLNLNPKNTAKVVSVVDGNGIDKVVYEFKPDVVIIEALWVSPEKMKELISIERYKDIRWVIRIHSDIGFLSTETLALSYVNEYYNINANNLVISANNEEFVKHFNKVCPDRILYYIPNLITDEPIKSCFNVESSDILSIGCFGALRILKNHVFQAMCAIEAANILGKKLEFHINVDAVNENNPVYKNLLELFNSSGHTLKVHKWLNHDEFRNLITTLDLGLQISYTESFNIVSSDFITSDKLILGSESISWLPCYLKTSTTNYSKVVKHILWLYNNKDNYFLKAYAKYKLNKYNKKALKIWNIFSEKM